MLHEIKNDVLDDVLLAGVFDGHAGTAASESVSKILPSLFKEELLTSNGQDVSVIKDALEKSWRTTCDLYRTGCDENGECVVDYDPVEGTLFAETGSADLIGELTWHYSLLLFSTIHIHFRRILTHYLHLFHCAGKM